MIAIDAVDIEYVLWERRRSMNADLDRAALPATPPATERTLPVVVFGDTVIPPVLPIVVQGDRVMRPRASIRFGGIRPGRSYRAIQAARDSGHEVLVCFVQEREIASYKGSEAQQLPTVGVIARLEEVVAQADGALEIVLDVPTRAIVTGRLQHDPFYWATCVPHPDPEVTSVISALMAAVKAQVESMARTLAPYSTPDQIEEALTFMRQIDHPGQLADFVTYSPTFIFGERIAILNALDPVERLRLVQHKLGA